MAGRIPDDEGIRGGSPFDPTHGGSPLDARGGFGAETSGVTDSKLSGNIHSSRGFRRALKRAQASGNRLSDQLPSKQNFSGPGFEKPNYFAQGGQRRGMHVGSGAPAMLKARREGASE